MTLSLSPPLDVILIALLWTSIPSSHLVSIYYVIVCLSIRIPECEWVCRNRRLGLCLFLSMVV